MNKSKVYSSRFFLLMFLVLALFLGLVYFQILPVNTKTALLITLADAGIFSLGTLIIAPALNKDHETFLLRFLVLTTIQFLTILIIIAILSISKFTGAKMIGFHLSGVFLVLLIIQSILLVKLNNKKN